MREIKFRGKYGNNPSLYGSLVTRNRNNNGIQERNSSAAILVDDGSIGQYTGMKDSTGKEIYEGDIILDDSYGEDVGRLVDVVVWGNELGAWVWKTDNTALIAQSIDTIEVVGNIYDNPELLGGADSASGGDETDGAER